MPEEVCETINEKSCRTVQEEVCDDPADPQTKTEYDTTLQLGAFNLFSLSGVQ